MRLKTKYKAVQFRYRETTFSSVSKVWECYHTKEKAVFGHIRKFSDARWLFRTKTSYSISADMCRIVADFMSQLEKPK
jgi:hypothetical protein